jgi:5-methyltetrahydrofolate--homocysteine methyltransferase
VEYIQSIYDAVLNGDGSAAETGVKAAIADGAPAETILKDGLIAAMGEVGRLFEAGEYYIPEMLVSARAMQSGLDLLKPSLIGSGAKSIGLVVVGTVKGDMHDIGKNLLAMMLQGSGFEVIDLGSDVPPEKFIAAIKEHHPHIVGLSALLTTTMPNMGMTLKALQEAGVRDQVKVMVGGAPVTDAFAQRLGADGYAPDASAAVRLAKSLIAG